MLMILKRFSPKIDQTALFLTTKMVIRRVFLHRIIQFQRSDWHWLE